MYEPQNSVDMEANPSFGDQKSWPSANHTSSSSSSPTSLLAAAAAAAARSGNINLDLFNDLVEIVPLVQSLIDRTANSSYTRRGSMIYTKTPSRESLLSKKTIDSKGRNAAQSIPTKKKRDSGNKDQEKEMEELIALREQVEDLQKKLLEKDELLKSAEASSKAQLNTVHAKFDELRQQAAEKDSLIKSIQQQLSDTKIKLADKQAALERMQWELMTSNKKVEQLQEEVNSTQGSLSSFLLFFEGLTKKDPAMIVDDYDVKPCYLDHIPHMDDWDDVEMQKMEEAREAYLAAVAAAKEKQDEESIVAAAIARQHLQSFVLGSDNGIKGSEVCLNGAVSPTSYGEYVH